MSDCNPLRPISAVGALKGVVDGIAEWACLSGEAARGEMVESHCVLQIADGILHLGAAAVVGLQFQGVAFSIGDEAVVAMGVDDVWACDNLKTILLIL